MPCFLVRRRLLRALAAAGLLLLSTTLQIAAQEVRRFEINLKSGELPREQRTVRVKQGEPVELRWTSDRPVTLHLHGYDIELAVKPGEPATMTFAAKISGRFSVSTVIGEPGKSRRAAHLHGARALYLEVHP